MNWTFEDFLAGHEWSHRFARVSLPVLVARAEKYQGYSDGEIPDFTYGDLAAIVASRDYAHPIHTALGSIGYALNALEEQGNWKFGKIPPIQLMVWSKGQGSPGDEAFAFIGISKDEVTEMSLEVRRFTARSVRADILNYSHWRDVLAKLGLRPLTVDLPSIEEVTKSPSMSQKGGESEEHKRLKHYLGSYYQTIGIRGKFTATFEEILLSGDIADLMLDDVEKRQRICIEVKSRISGYEDHIRGIFQSVKYRAVLAAQEKYELMRNPSHTARKLQTLLVTENDLPPELRQLSDLLEVSVRKVKVPADYRISHKK